ncbi:pumilio homolog 24 [Nicotiana tomentosiformis]|uniref:pumilio homolog 24 n=1 Tax=Nicotiana tomentosiformis TaxID=4098 RepID=UPI00051BDAE4|nr:pumilio homolog 24 [Nicotiana tomentosiformis]
MAAKPQKRDDSKKRKHAPAAALGKSTPKKLKSSTGVPAKVLKKPHNKFSKPGDKKQQPKPHVGNDPVDTKRQRRIQAKELAEARKKKRKKHYTLEQELASLWEKMRTRNIAKEERSRLVTDALKKMKGKIPEIASSHVSSRVLQTCVKHCTQDERNAVFVEIRPHFITLASNTYAVHLVTKMLDTASKEQLAEFISSLHGHVATLLRHMVGSLVVEHAYQLGNAAQKQTLLMELYSPELQLFKDLTSLKEARIVDVISTLKLQKTSVIRHMTSVLQPILEKGILDHSIIHRALVEYLTIADQSSAADVIQQLSSPDLVRMIHTKDGSRIGIFCIKHGTAKDRKKIIKGMKDKVGKIARDKCGTLVLVSILSIVDDTKLLSKVIIRELEGILTELLSDQNGRRPLLQLLHPNSSRHFSPDELVALGSSVPSLVTKSPSDVNVALDEETEASGLGEADKEDSCDTGAAADATQSSHLNEGGKKDPLTRRQELLVNSGLAEKLIDACCEMAGELLKSNFGKEVIYEVAMEGADSILHATLDGKLKTLHGAIATLAAHPKVEESDKEHLLEHFHSSRTIRKLILDSPSFACTLYEKALKGKCAIWAQGHSAKVISALLETSSSKVHKLVKKEVQPLVDDGILKLAK